MVMPQAYRNIELDLTLSCTMLRYIMITPSLFIVVTICVIVIAALF